MHSQSAAGLGLDETIESDWTRRGNPRSCRIPRRMRRRGPGSVRVHRGAPLMPSPPSKPPFVSPWRRSSRSRHSPGCGGLCPRPRRKSLRSASRESTRAKPRRGRDDEDYRKTLTVFGSKVNVLVTDAPDVEGLHICKYDPQRNYGDDPADIITAGRGKTPEDAIKDYLRSCYLRRKADLIVCHFPLPLPPPRLPRGIAGGMTMHDFSGFDDLDFVSWLLQYSGRQAGFYPGLRRSRVAAEREAAKRGLPWWRGETYYTPPCRGMSRRAS